MITIANDLLKVTVSEKGAELQSLKFKDLEYLWQADKAYWVKHSPILFPIVGELKDGKYIFENKVYDMPRHGFARDKTFGALQTSGVSVVFILRSDDTTLATYPFTFILKVEYRLENNSLFCTYIVENADTKPMFFSVGGHPAFNVPLQSNLQYSDYSLRFNNDTFLKKYVLQKGLTSDKTEDIQLNNHELQLHPSLFYDDAIVLKHAGSSQVELMTPNDAHGLQFNFEGFPYFGIWAAKDAPFVCLEPWCGIADHIYHDQQLIHKEGINKLKAGESWRRRWSVELF